MAHIYRPALGPGGKRQFRARKIALNGVVHRVAFNPDGAIDAIVSVATTNIGENGIAKLTEPAYVRGALRFQTYCHNHASFTAPGAYTPWSHPHEVLELFKELLRSLGAELTESTTEKDVWHVDVADEDDTARVVEAICGTFHLYETASSAGLYKWSNPFKVPVGERITRRVPGAPANDAGWPTVTPRFRFRMPMTGGSGLRTDATDMLRHVIPALQAFGAPPAIVMMIETMIEGLARIMEQANISLLDWWEESGFGESVAMTSKGHGRRRVKAQRFSPRHHARLVEFADTSRKALDPNGWGLDEWRSFLTDPTIKKSVRERAARQAPLFPTKRGKFHSRSGILDQWYRPAMRAAGLPTRTHYVRHCGVNDFLAYVDARIDLTPDEKKAAKLAFAVSMGWKWPQVMLDRYSLPQRKEAEIAASADWLRERRRRLDALDAGVGRASARPSANDAAPPSDQRLSKLVRHRLAA